MISWDYPMVKQYPILEVSIRATPMAGWFTLENPIGMDDKTSDTSIYHIEVVNFWSTNQPAQQKQVLSRDTSARRFPHRNIFLAAEDFRILSIDPRDLMSRGHLNICRRLQPCYQSDGFFKVAHSQKVGNLNRTVVIHQWIYHNFRPTTPQCGQKHAWILSILGGFS